MTLGIESDMFFITECRELYLERGSTLSREAVLLAIMILVTKTRSSITRGRLLSTSTHNWPCLLARVHSIFLEIAAPTIH